MRSAFTESVFVAWVVTAAGCARQPAPASPRVEVASESARMTLPESERDLGNVPVDQERPLQTSFEFENNGSAVLRITRIEQSCLCTDAEVAPLAVQPGGKGQIRLALKRTLPERKEATVTVHSNAANARAVRVKVRWRAVAPVEFYPYSLDFGSVLANTTLEREVAVVVRAYDTMRAYDPGMIGCSPKTSLDARWKSPSREPLVAGDERKLRIVLHTGAASGDRRGEIVIPVRGHPLREIKLPVRWTVHDVVEVSARSVFLGAGSVATKLVKNVTVASANGAPLELRGIRVNPTTGLSATIIKASATVTLLRLEANLRSGGTQAWQLYVECVRPDARTITVPVTAFAFEANSRERNTPDEQKN